MVRKSEIIMMDKEFLDIANDILYSKEYQKLKGEIHHGTSRYEHSIRVAKKTFLRSKKLGLDYKKATRAALLHDFFSASDITTKWLKIAYEHPQKAYKNACKYYSLSDKESNIIRSHMFPLSKEFPKSREAWIVTLADKKTAIYEYGKYKFNPKNLVPKMTSLLSKSSHI